MPSSPPLRWSDLKSYAVGVWGVGVEGHATITRLKKLGVTPLVVVDDAPRTARVLATNHGGLEALSDCEIVVKSPGISRYSPEVRLLEKNGVAVVGGLGLWLEELGAEKVIGITGTKGKSTTTSIAGHLARNLGYRCFVGGNLGAVPWSVDVSADVDLWIIEVSSYQATDLWSSPGVVALTSLFEDHLNWHGSVDRYYRDKLSMCGRPGSRITIANGMDERLRERADQLRPGPRWIVPSLAQRAWVTSLKLRGEHNEMNALLAAACLEEMDIGGAKDADRLLEAAKGYQHLPHRLETIATVGDVEYVDDSLSTNVLPTLRALEVFERRSLALLVGGYDRGIDYQPLAYFVANRGAPTLVLTLPQNGDRIKEAVNAAGGHAVGCSDIADAVRRASRWLPPGGVVLLSPAAASYGLFPNYLARSEAFRVAVSGIERAVR